MNKNQLGPCDEWVGAKHGFGYGQLWVGGRLFRAHRLVWMQDNGHTDLHILHSCDNPSCINIDHLSAGTHTDNMQDMIAKGRYKNPAAAAQKAKTHCPQGHEYILENTGRYSRDNVRYCKTCNRIKASNWYRKKKLKV